MKGGKFYRWWPTVMTCVLGLTLASGTSSLVGSDIRDHDLSVIVRGHLDIHGSLANPKGTSGRGLELIARGAVDVKPLMTHHFKLSDFAEAWDTFVERRGGAIRVMLHPHD